MEMEEPFGFHKNRESLEHLNHYQFLKEDRASLSYYAIRRGLQVLFLEYFSPAFPFSQAQESFSRVLRQLPVWKYPPLQIFQIEELCRRVR